jgi:hypothetical protein
MVNLHDFISSIPIRKELNILFIVFQFFFFFFKVRFKKNGEEWRIEFFRIGNDHKRF